MKSIIMKIPVKCKENIFRILLQHYVWTESIYEILNLNQIHRTKGIVFEIQYLRIFFNFKSTLQDLNELCKNTWTTYISY